jgi:hypothetical protein
LAERATIDSCDLDFAALARPRDRSRESQSRGCGCRRLRTNDEKHGKKVHPIAVRKHADDCNCGRAAANVNVMRGRGSADRFPGCMLTAARPVAVGIVLVALLMATPVFSQEVRYLRVGTGPPGESLFPIGGLLASAVSNPPGSQPCARGGSCGVPGLIAVALATSGSVSDIWAIDSGRLDAALVLSDIALWSAQGAPPFDGHPIASIRSVANLYPSQVHLVARRGANIQTPGDLKGKRVSLGEKGSGTLVHAQRILAAWGVNERTVKAQYLRSALAADALQGGQLDAFFVMDSAPVPSVVELAKNRPIRLVPISADGAEKLRQSDPLLRFATIPAGTYADLDEEVPTVEVGVSLVVSAALPDDLIYALTQAVWHPSTVRMLKFDQPYGAAVRPEAAVTDLGLALHPGAAQYYTAHGITALAR